MAATKQDRKCMNPTAGSQWDYLSQLPCKTLSAYHAIKIVVCQSGRHRGLLARSQRRNPALHLQTLVEYVVNASGTHGHCSLTESPKKTQASTQATGQQTGPPTAWVQSHKAVVKSSAPY